MSYLNLLVGNIIPIFYTPVMLELLGQSEYGLYKLASSAISYLSLMSFGIGGAITRYLIKARQEGGQDAEEQMFGLFFLVDQVIAVLALIVGAVITLNLGLVYSASLTAAELQRMQVLVGILTINTVVGFSATSYNAIVSTHERFIFLQAINILTTTVMPIANLVVLFFGFASVGMVVSSLTINVVVRVAYLIYVRRFLELRPRFDRMPFGQMREVLQFSFWVFVANLASQLYNATDTMIIGAIPALATIGVAVYNVGAVFNNLVFSVAVNASGLLTPKANKLVFSGASPGELTDLVIRFGRYQAYLVSLICTGFVAFGREFVVLYVGPEYHEAYWVAILMMIPSCVPLLQSVALSIAQAKNMHRFRSVVYLFIALLNVVGTYLLVHKYGIIGAAFMTGLANVIGQGFIMNWYYWKRVGLDIPRFWKQTLPIFICPVFLCAATIFLARWIDFTQVVTFCAGVVIYTAIFGGYSWFFVMNDEEKEIVKGPINKLRARRKKGETA